MFAAMLKIICYCNKSVDVRVARQILRLQLLQSAPGFSPGLSSMVPNAALFFSLFPLFLFFLFFSFSLFLFSKFLFLLFSFSPLLLPLSRTIQSTKGARCVGTRRSKNGFLSHILFSRLAFPPSHSLAFDRFLAPFLSSLSVFLPLLSPSLSFSPGARLCNRSYSHQEQSNPQTRVRLQGAGSLSVRAS
jgi:hypothetical protein